MKMITHIKISPILLVLFFICVTVSGNTNPRQTLTVKVIEKSSPAVVNISTEKIISTSPFSNYGGQWDIFRNFFEEAPQQERKVPNSLGSGVVFDHHGHILTNEHVILKASIIKVTMKDGSTYEAERVGSDPQSDLAILRIKHPKKLKLPLNPIPIGNSEEILIGETVIAIGNPFGLSHSATTGIISAVNRTISDDTKTFRNFIQTDALINPGNSGGPLINMLGELIGINTAIYSKAQGIGFAIPINRAKSIVEEIITYGKVHKAWIGIRVSPITKSIQKTFQYANSTGAFIREIDSDSPAAKSGVLAGDILLKVNNEVIKDSRTYQLILAETRVNKPIEFSLVRNGKHLKKLVTPVRFPKSYSNYISEKKLGITTEDIPKKYSTRIQGVVISSVTNQGAAWQRGLQRGDIIRAIDNDPIQNMTEFNAAMIKIRFKSSILLNIQRRNASGWVSIELN